ncbi:MAG: 50S ribosomal protein L11 methyltransferase [Desulfobacterales bacterium]|nr:50S ribosomal protein L11 methyltransferase [Desulfobacterales bacterium]MBS3755618.1 50S ribosomal protein L11 methyltransferase [Desulfobacterales bacterium]
MINQPTPFKNKLWDAVMEYVRNADHRCTPQDIEGAISLRLNTHRRTVRQAVRDLVLENRLVYTYLMGHTFLDISYRQPVDVGGGVILAPAEASCRPEPDQILIRIAPGASFGMGDHATTRICLQLISWAMHTRHLPAPSSALRVLDIGTGSGVLAIGACLMGAVAAVGIDTDACAQAEARQNVRLNGLEDRVCIMDTIENGLEICLQNHGAALIPLILANLRYPTLAHLCSRITAFAAPGALLIFSGFRQNELPDLVDTYESCGFQCLRTLSENAWHGFILKKLPR